MTILPSNGEPQVRILRLTIAVWTIAVLAVFTRAFLAPQRNSVYAIYASAAHRWLAAQPLCIIASGQADPYRYGPPFIPLVLPFALLPDFLGGVLWRLACTGCLLAGCSCLIAALKRRRLVDGIATDWLWLILLPLSLGNINNGQANVLLAALLAATSAAVLDQRWTVAAVCTALCCVVKLYPLALAAVLIVLFTRQFAVRFVVATVGLLLLPCALQTPTYVTQEYVHWTTTFTHVDCRRDALPAESRRDLRLLLRLIDPALANLNTSISGGLAALIALRLSVIPMRNRGRRLARGSDFRRDVYQILFLGTCWMLLCGPATESATYILLAPMLLWRLADVLEHSMATIRPIVVFAATAAMVAYNAACWFPHGRSLIYALQPIATLALFIECLASPIGVTRREERTPPHTNDFGSTRLRFFYSDMHGKKESSRGERVRTHW